MAKILIVDDDAGILDAVSFFLRECDYTVDILQKGQDTFAKVLTYKPDLIILDVLMSGVDGRDICAFLKRHDETKEIPIILMSAHPSAHKDAITCKAEEYMSKPFEIEELLGTIHKYLPDY